MSALVADQATKVLTLEIMWSPFASQHAELFPDILNFTSSLTLESVRIYHGAFSTRTRILIKQNVKLQETLQGGEQGGKSPFSLLSEPISPSSLLFPPISPSSQLFLGHFSLLPFLFLPPLFAISALHIKPLIDGEYRFCRKLMLFLVQIPIYIVGWSCL